MHHEIEMLQLVCAAPNWLRARAPWPHAPMYASLDHRKGLAHGLRRQPRSKHGFFSLSAVDPNRGFSAEGWHGGSGSQLVVPVKPDNGTGVRPP
eukprot:4569382-Pleurochrysis_carterae.AAC.1